jgi:hypothetical protein
MKTATLLVSNECPDLVSDADLHAYVMAQDIQLDQFAEQHGQRPKIDILSSGPMPTASDVWPFHLVTTSDQADALGYHDDTTRVFGIVAVKDSLDNGDSWTATGSHEALEMAGDPDVVRIAAGLRIGRKIAAVAYEVCDACENDEYEINGVKMSNWLFPAWFKSNAPAGSQFDYMKQLSAPFTLSPGGYISYTTDLARWQQKLGSTPKAHQRDPAPFSRRWRRHRKAA